MLLLEELVVIFGTEKLHTFNLEDSRCIKGVRRT